jgi:hypothetical protein
MVNLLNRQTYHLHHHPHPLLVVKILSPNQNPRPIVPAAAAASASLEYRFVAVPIQHVPFSLRLNLSTGGCLSTFLYISIPLGGGTTAGTLCDSTLVVQSTAPPNNIAYLRILC